MNPRARLALAAAAVAGDPTLPADPGLAELTRRYPLTSQTLLALDHDGAAALAHLAVLDQRWRDARRGLVPRGAVVASAVLPRVPQSFDIIYAGGGLSLFGATLMAQAGYKVLVFDARRVGVAHRMWNISEPELRALVRLGFCTWEELQPAILRRYRRSIVRVHATATAPRRELDLEGVLDLAIDAEQLLQIARRRLLAAGGSVLDGRSFRRLSLAVRGPAGVVVDLEAANGRERYGGRLLVNAMGALSPLTLALHGGLPFGGVCPTVGTLARGFRQGADLRGVDLDCGEVLVSCDGAWGGRQLLWEGFPGRADELTVYLFYYDLVRRGAAAAPQSLLALFEHYFALLPSYKAPGPDFEHLRALYGFIPAHLAGSGGRSGAGVDRGVLSIGDAAADHSALTFCGFGSHLRNLGRICELTDMALRHDLLEASHLANIRAGQPNLAPHAIFSQFMRPWGDSDDVNNVLGSVCAALATLDRPTVRRFFQDRSSVYDYHRILRALRRGAPGIVGLAARVLGPRGSLRCLRELSTYLLGALLRLPGALLEQPAALGLVALAERRPTLALRLRAIRAARQVMREH
jgi:lycopene cyclase CruA